MEGNPWQVDSIWAFTYLHCPECDFNTRESTFFQDHAVENHPLSCVLFKTKFQGNVAKKEYFEDSYENFEEGDDH